MRRRARVALVLRRRRRSGREVPRAYDAEAPPPARSIRRVRRGVTGGRRGPSSLLQLRPLRCRARTNAPRCRPSGAARCVARGRPPRATDPTPARRPAPPPPPPAVTRA
eukprot:scaffold701_cov351-Prasinococcus_capsulatus_cf.AAC.7